MRSPATRVERIEKALKINEPEAPLVVLVPAGLPESVYREYVDAQQREHPGEIVYVDPKALGLVYEYCPRCGTACLVEEAPPEGREPRRYCLPCQKAGREPVEPEPDGENRIGERPIVKAHVTAVFDRMKKQGG